VKISVVIPTYNRCAVLARTLDTLFAQDFPAEHYELIVAVDGSTDGTVEFLHGLKPACGLQVVADSRNRGAAAARNSALRVAHGEVVLFIDDDILCDRALLKVHVAVHQGSRRRVVSGPVFMSGESPPTLATEKTARDGQWRDLIEHRIENDWRLAAGANTSMSKELLDQCGWYDESLTSMYEDLDLHLRLLKMGAQFVYEPGAVTHTLYVKSTRALVEDAASSGRRQVALSRREPSFRRHATISAIGHGSGWNRAVRKLAALSPFSPEPLLRAPCWIAERMSRDGRLRRLGMKLLDWRIAIVTWRASLAEAGSWEALIGDFGLRLPVLMHHKVTPLRSPGDLYAVTPARFARQMARLARHGYVGIRPSDWLTWIREGKSLPHKPVLITFDDGYADNAEYALPVLRQYGFGAAVYMVTGQVGGTNAWDQAAGVESQPLMTAEQIRYWADEGIEFGAHSRTHPDLTMLGEAQLEDEVAGSKQDLENLVGRAVLSFAYPYGCYNEAVQRCVAAHFALALSCEPGVNDLTTDPLLLRRHLVRDCDSVTDVLHRFDPMRDVIARGRGFAARLSRRLGRRLGRVQGQPCERWQQLV
jgi:peptidoglycan/xylan/chitin deacetylase (PgdA/CDA1 family)/glycosyltransferase involved in cell wall biosynthesis